MKLTVSDTTGMVERGARLPPFPKQGTEDPIFGRAMLAAKAHGYDKAMPKTTGTNELGP